MKNVYIFLFLCCSFPFYAQTIKAECIAQIPFKSDHFVGVDKFDNLYGIQKNVFFKLEGDKKYQFTDLQLGKLTSVDILNPLKIVLFYKDMNTVVLIDDRLNEIKRINFNTLKEFRTVEFVNTGNNQNLWIFNVDLQELEVFDYNRNTISAHTQPLFDKVTQQKSGFNNCWILSEENLYQFNSYGSLIQKIPQENIHSIAVDKDKVVALKEGRLIIFSDELNTFVPLSISEIAVKDFYYHNENLYLYDGKAINKYHLDIK